jgi:uncharacterized SAM-binding protein YcdF (DUF218 family)
MVLALLLIVFSRPWVGQWLIINQKPRKSDAIIVLGGGPINRIQEGVALYRQGYAPYLVLSGGTQDFSQATQAQVMRWQAVDEFGVPQHAIVLDNRSYTTYQNALNTRQIMLTHHWTSALVVSSDYHMRRVRFLFSRVYQDLPIRLTYVAASDPWFRPRRWWSNPESALITISEYAKLGINAIQVLLNNVHTNRASAG